MDNITQTQHNHLRFFCLLWLLLGLITLRYSFLIDIPPVIFLTIIICIAIFGDINEIIGIFMCCIALHESIDLFYALAFCLIIFVFKFFNEIRLNPTITPVFLMVIWEMLHCFRADFSLMVLITNCIPLIVLAVFMCIDIKKIDYSYIVRVFAITLAVICMSLLLKLLYISDFNVIKAFAGLQRLGYTASEITLDGKGSIQTNTLGILCVLAITGLMQLRTRGNGTMQDIVLTVMLMVFGTLTASRTYLVCLSLMWILLILSQHGSLGKKLRFLGSMVILLIVALILFYLCFPNLMEYYVGRFNVTDITTGRDVLLVKYDEFISTNPRIMFWGLGLNHFGDDLMIKYRVAAGVPHNGIQELIIAWGLPGLILFFFLLGVMIWRSKYFCKRQKLLNYIPLLIILVKSQAGQMLNSSYTMLAFSYAYLSLCMYLRDDENM